AVSKQHNFLGTIANSVESESLIAPLSRVNRPLIYLVHELAHAYSEKALTRIRDLSSKIVFAADGVHESFHRKVAIPEHKAKILPQGILDREFGKGSREKARRFVREKLGLDQSAFVVLSSGNYVLRKGLDWFVQIARKTLDTPEA